MKQLSESFLNGSSSIYVEQMYQSWKKDPLSVHASWAAYFQNIEKGLPPGSAFQLPPSTITSSYQTSSVINEKEISDCMKVLLLIRAYQVSGHLLANTDPLELTTKEIPPELQLNSYGFTESDLDREFYIGTATMSGFLAANRPKMKLRDIIQRLKETYCGTIGYEYMHIQDRSKCNWIRERIETPIQHQFSKEEKLIILDRLIWATNFEGFCALKWPAAKRFGIDGSESLIPGIKALIDKSTDSGVETVVMGMSHRGRLNVLSNVVRKPLEAIFHEFSGGTLLNEGDFYTGSGDVKYHLGTSYVRPTRSGKKVHISLLANPSHLEAVDPVVIGKVRAHQYFAKDNDYLKTMGLLLHGDASFAAQGVVYELFDLSGLPNYTTGGTIHIIINNQIGFTTDPRAGRSTTYCSDIAKMAEIPVFHVNGDDPEAVVHVCELASEWRQTFKSDVVIDLVCYRKFGHNEADEPRFTQPLMYKKIDQQKSTLSKYTEKLLNEGMITSEQLHKIVDKVQNILHEAYNNANKHKPKLTDWLESVWEGFRGPQQISRIRDTGVSIDMLKHVGIAISSTPENFSLHPNLKKLFLARKKSIETGEKN
jgi:2-oxoglutarate dehydrogenase E1 component